MVIKFLPNLTSAALYVNVVYFDSYGLALRKLESQFEERVLGGQGHCSVQRYLLGVEDRSFSNSLMSSR